MTATAATPKEQARSVDVGVRAALEARKGGQFKRAFDLLAALVAQFPKNARIRHELGVLYAVHGQFDLASAQLGEALRLDPNLVAARRGVAEVLRASNRCGEALPHYAALLRQSTQRPVALRGLALCREATGDTVGSRAALAQLTRDHGDTDAGRWAKSYLRLVDAAPKGRISAATAEREGLLHFRAKRYAEAGAWFELACRRGPSADRCYRLGVARLGERDFLAAAIAFRQALQLDAKHLPTLSAWPTAARKLRQEARGGLRADFADSGRAPAALRVAAALRDDNLLLAEQIASAAIAGGHKGRVVRLLRAEGRLRSGQITAAEKDVREVLRVAPGLVVARHCLAAIYVRKHQPALARPFAGLPALPTPPAGLSWPATANPDADLAGFVRWRHAAIDHMLRRMSDPGLKPYPAFVPPTPLNPESIRAAVPPAPLAAPRRRRGR